MPLQFPSFLEYQKLQYKHKKVKSEGQEHYIIFNPRLLYQIKAKVHQDLHLVKVEFLGLTYLI